MSQPCNTVKIKATTGSYPFSVINESDFDPAKHELYVAGNNNVVDTPAVDVPAVDTPPTDQKSIKGKRGAK